MTYIPLTDDPIDETGIRYAFNDQRKEYNFTDTIPSAMAISIQGRVSSR